MDIHGLIVTGYVVTPLTTYQGLPTHRLAWLTIHAVAWREWLGGGNSPDHGRPWQTTAGNMGLGCRLYGLHICATYTYVHSIMTGRMQMDSKFESERHSVPM